VTDENAESSLKKTSERLSQVSNSFCLAKWMQVTLHLHNGHTHSCHHPNTHKVPLEELKDNPSALHNTKFKKDLRQEMMVGKRPSECSYCWGIEDTPGEHYSDRAIKSNDNWASPFFARAVRAAGQENINPSYVEVSFSHACNLKCVYCGPSISSKWEAEMKKFGDYPILNTHHSLDEAKRQNKESYPVGEPNPYVDAFWDWWPSLSKDLKVFRITGGEPLLVKDTLRAMDWLMDHPNANLEFAVNTNLMVADEKLDAFLGKAAQLVDQKKVKEFSVYTSLDTWGASAEYIRFGLDIEKFKVNLEKTLSSHTHIRVAIMCTFNLLSVPNFHELIDYVIDLKNRFPTQEGCGPRVTLDISYLTHPNFMTVSLLPKELHSLLDDCYTKMSEAVLENGRQAFDAHEKNKLKRLLAFVQRPLLPDKELELKKDFAIFFSEADRRRELSFSETFPIFKDLMDECKNLALKDLYGRRDFAEKDLKASTRSLEDIERHMKGALEWHGRAQREVKRSEENIQKLKVLFEKDLEGFESEV